MAAARDHTSKHALGISGKLGQARLISRLADVVAHTLRVDHARRERGDRHADLLGVTTVLEELREITGLDVKAALGGDSGPALAGKGGAL